MKSTTIVSTFLTGAAALNVLQFDIYRTERLRLSKRDTVDVGLDNRRFQYNLNLTIGTPPQSFSLQLDTGSSDLWVNIAESAFCSAANSTCVGGLYDPTASSTYQVSIPGGFNIGYVDGSGASGDYATDTVVLGGVTVTNQTIGVANVSDITAGLIGVSFPYDEAVCNTTTQALAAACSPYPNIVDTLVSQGFINTAAYSLWLDDLDASTGSILFGGIDTSKYQGDLVALDIIPNAKASSDTNKIYTDMNVVWSNLSISGYPNFWTENDTTLATLDSGTSFTYLPANVFQLIAEGANVTYDNASTNYYVNCAFREANVTFDFTFGGSDGPTISVDIAELVFEQSDNTTLTDGTPACQLAMGPSTDPGSCLLGDSFLRSAYVVYDLDNKQIAIAQTNFNGSESNIVEIAQTIPNVSSTAAYTSLPAAATSAAGSATAIGPVTATGATGTVGATPATYTGAGVSLRTGTEYGLCGSIFAILSLFNLL